MKITDNRNKPNVVMFNDLGIGDCFEFNGDFYIKIYPIKRDDPLVCSYSAFELGNCKALSFIDTTVVTKVDMEIIIN